MLHLHYLWVSFRRRVSDIVWIVEHFLRRRKPSHVLDFFLFSLVVLMLGWLANLIWFKPYSVDHFFERVSFQFLWVHPEENTRYRWMESIGLGGRHHLLNNVSATSLK
ncbi:MAG: hypothetical protein NZ521_07420, partial [Flammeovirgaceae bacterium]|nr:hypothetical protein [Flammeovirgaceae bacterium]MDW8288038.1 hypothetical protein [Flammeovirgaceae bacterium]